MRTIDQIKQTPASELIAMFHNDDLLVTRAFKILNDRMPDLIEANKQSVIEGVRVQYGIILEICEMIGRPVSLHEQIPGAPNAAERK